MVRIAIAGGSGNVGQEIVDALVQRNRHDILILSRKDAPKDLATRVKWSKINYDNVAQLATALTGIETVLSFVAGDSAYLPQKNLIDASIQAGVRRFAPSEWATAGLENTPWYGFKENTRKYLAELNKNKKVLEYTLFQPGLFTNYMTFPFSSSKHVDLFEMPFNFHKRRALVPEDYETAVITLTTAQDTAKTVALAVEYKGEWPVVGGIKGSDITIGELIALGENIRGPFDVEKLKVEELRDGTAKTSWVPEVTHPAIPQESRVALASSLLAGVLLSMSSGDFRVSDEWNQLLSDYSFIKPDEFLTNAWEAIGEGAKVINLD